MSQYAVVPQSVEGLPSKQKIFAGPNPAYRSESFNDRCARQSGKTLDCSDRRTVDSFTKI